MDKIWIKILIVLVNIIMWLFIVPFILVLMSGIFVGGLIALIVMLVGIPAGLLYKLRDKLNENIS